MISDPNLKIILQKIVNFQIFGQNVNKILDHKKVYFDKIDKIVFKLLNLKMDSMKRILRYTENGMADLGCHRSVPKICRILKCSI